MTIKLMDKKYFEINCGGAMEEYREYPNLENCLNLKILGVSRETANSMMVELENGKKCFIEIKDNSASPNLLLILNPIKDFGKKKDKKLKDLLEYDFSVAERLS